MKRRSYHHRVRIFDAPLLKPPAEDRSSNSFRFLSLGRQPGTQAKRIFIIKRTIHLAPTNSAEGRKVQHVLIFDDHPESLLLVFGSATPEIDLFRPPRASSWRLVLLSIVIISNLVAAILSSSGGTRKQGWRESEAASPQRGSKHHSN